MNAAKRILLLILLLAGCSASLASIPSGSVSGFYFENEVPSIVEPVVDEVYYIREISLWRVYRLPLRIPIGGFFTDLVLTDQVGSILQIVDADGNVVNQYDYDAFGNINPANSFEGIPNRYMFQGREWDANAGHYYFRNRTYIPEWGCFTGPDMNLGNGILGEPNGIGNYLAFNNNGLRFRDPTGLDVYVVYRPFAGEPGWLYRQAWNFTRLAGHVYLEFTDENMGAPGSQELQEWHNLLASHGLKTTLTSHTFSFHPASVMRERHEALGRLDEAKKWPPSGTDLMGVKLTLGGGVLWDDLPNDQTPAQLGRTEHGLKVTKRRITNNRAEQLAIYKQVRESWLHETTDYSVELKNCGDWAYRMIKASGLTVPWGSRLSNLGVGSGGLLDWLGVSHVAYAGVVGTYVTKEAVTTAGAWTTEQVSDVALWTWEHRDVSVEPIYDRSGIPEDYTIRVGITIPLGGRR